MSDPHPVRLNLTAGAASVATAWPFRRRFIAGMISGGVVTVVPCVGFDACSAWPRDLLGVT